MSHSEDLTRYVGNFVDELVCSGLEHVVISPGSRSTPLAILCTEHTGLKEWILVDERSAAFFALGIAKQTKRPVALVCTSGTAAANYMPAIVEAYYARVPLIVLTADRPHELRGIGASQTMNQMNMYGDFVKDFQEMALPDCSEEMLQYVRNRASRAYTEAQQGNPGPVHLNFPFREPLMPDLTLEDLWGMDEAGSYNTILSGEKRLSSAQLQELLDKLKDKQQGLFVCGPQVDETLAKHITELAEQWQIPILADPLSQLRAGEHSKETIIENYDSLLRYSFLHEQLKPDFIVRFGAMPLSKNYLLFLKAHKDILQITVENDSEMREPTNSRGEYIFADGSLFCTDLIESTVAIGSNNWLSRWKRLNETVKEVLSKETVDRLTEGTAVQKMLEVIPDENPLFVANSMPVRDLDTFFMTTNKSIFIHANRGVSGIDGIVSTALGIAASMNKHVTLVVGDLSFYHDLNGLFAAKRYELNMTILLINNNGGGIFSFLPQAEEANHFEALFGTPLDIEFEKVVSMYGGKYNLVDSNEMLTEALSTSYEIGGLSVIEVQTERGENVAWHRELWKKIEKRLIADGL